MKIAFFGTSEFAVPSLDRLAASRHLVAAVVTQPDRKKGRHLRVAASPVKREAMKHKITLYQPDNASGKDSVDFLKQLDADIFVVAAFGQILKKDVLEIPKRFCVNIHASILPKYRGAAPVNWAIINGDRETGVTIIRMNEKMDEGDIILQRKTVIEDNDTSRTLEAKLTRLGAGLIAEALDAIEDDRAEFIRQDNKEATYAYKLHKRDGLIDWSENAEGLRNRVRGLIPWPGAYTHWNGALIKIWSADFDANISEDAECGVIIRLEDGMIGVNTGKGMLAIRELQMEGKKRLNAADFLRGHKIKTGQKFQ